MIHTTWEAWKKEHPKTLVLSTDTGFKRDYKQDPYESYAKSSQLMFSAGDTDGRFHPKAVVLGIVLGGMAKAYPFSELEHGPNSFNDSIGPEKVTVQYDPSSRTARIRGPDGKDLPSVVAYWFAWTAFHPKTEVFKGPR
jgi:hypothetical protein